MKKENQNQSINVSEDLVKLDNFIEKKKNQNEALRSLIEKINRPQEEIKEMNNNQKNIEL